MGSDDREKALELAFTQIEKQFGKGSIMKLGKAEGLKGIQAIPTGSISLDSALGVGGVPRGRIIEIYGPEGSGKTSLTLHIIAEAQKTGGVAAFIDAEHALDPEYARNLGIDLDDLLLSQPDMPADWYVVYPDTISIIAITQTQISIEALDETTQRKLTQEHCYRVVGYPA